MFEHKSLIHQVVDRMETNFMCYYKLLAYVLVEYTYSTIIIYRICPIWLKVNSNSFINNVHLCWVNQHVFMLTLWVNSLNWSYNYYKYVKFTSVFTVILTNFYTKKKQILILNYPSINPTILIVTII